MTTYSLYVKVDKNSGLHYLGMTTQDPYTYPGSGKDWQTHLELNLTDVKTDVLFVTDDKKEFSEVGRYYSRLWKVVTAMDDFGNKIWANRIPETGGGAGNKVGNVQYWPSEEQIQRSIETKKLNGTHKNAGSPTARQKAKATSLKRYNTLKTGDDSSRVKMVATKRKNGTDKGYKKKKTVKSENAWNVRRQKGTDSWSIAEKIECPHCGKIGAKSGAMYQWHFENCKHRLSNV